MRIPVAIVLATFCLAASAQEMQPGRYRTTVTSDIPGMKGRTMTDEDCITAKDIADGLTKAGVEKEAECKVSDFRRSPGKVGYKLACTEDGQKSAGDVSGTMTADSFDFRFTLAGPATGGKPTATRVVGKRIGACK
jgi:hypothetical protein